MSAGADNEDPTDAEEPQFRARFVEDSTKMRTGEQGRYKPASWRELLKTYCHETTLHGLRYIAGDTAYRSRR